MFKMLYNRTTGSEGFPLGVDLGIAEALAEESRLARALLRLNDDHEYLLKQPRRRPIDDDFLGWHPWVIEVVPRQTPLILRFQNGDVSAERTYEDTLKWGERASEIVAYRLAHPTVGVPPVPWNHRFEDIPFDEPVLVRCKTHKYPFMVMRPFLSPQHVRFLQPFVPAEFIERLVMAVYPLEDVEAWLAV